MSRTAIAQEMHELLGEDTLEQRAEKELAEERFEQVEAVDSEGKPRKQADVLVEIGRTHKLFRDPGGTAYAQVEIRGHREVHAIDSGAYREVLAERFLRVAGKGCNRNALGDALTTLSSLARFDGEVHDVFLRVAGSGQTLYIDMGRADWACIEVTASGWHYSKNPPMFRRAGAPLPLPEPAAPDFGRLWRYANVCDEHKPLVAGFMLSALRPVGPFPQLHFSGEQGTGKSTLAKVIKSLTDPSASPLRSPPKEVRDLLVGALNGWCLAMDNLSFLTPQLSDALCRLSTGGAISERTLYTNTDEVLVEVQRPVILNGIEDLAVRPDLAERGLHVELEPIRNRKPEFTFWADLRADAPHIFGALLDGLALAIRDHAHINVGRLPRMADFALWAAAGMPALGFTADEFMQAYRANIEDGMSAGIDSSPVGRALVQFAGREVNWAGTAAELQNALAREADENTLRSPAWPKTPRGLAGTVRRLAPALRLAGVEVETERAPDASRARLIRLCNRGKRPSRPSISSKPAAILDGSDDSDDQNRVLHNAEGFEL